MTALVELKARFDEEANIRWARDLERAGVQVVYGFIDLKTHAKVSMVVRREAAVDADLCPFRHGQLPPDHGAHLLPTSRSSPAIRRWAAMRRACSNYMTGYARPERMEKIAFAPVTLRPTLISLIDAEIVNAKAGRPAAIWAKLNSAGRRQADRSSLRGLACRRADRSC